MILWIFLLVSSAGISIVQGSSCRDIIVDDCPNIGSHGSASGIKTEAECQDWCSEVVDGGDCSYYKFIREENLCRVYVYTYETFLKSCKIFGGPKEADFETCYNQATDFTDPCVSLVEGECQLEGTVVEHLDDWSLCQTACMLNTGCDYWLYDSNVNDCQLFDRADRDCNLFYGLPSPSVDGCSGELTTTTTSTSTITSTTSIETTTSSFSGPDCRDIVADDCDYGKPFQSTPDIDEAACQGYCGVVYEGRCTFYEYDKDARTCNVFDTPVPDYLAACSNLGGPKQPPIESCSIFVDPCIAFVEGTCSFDGNSLGTLEQVESASRCQSACEFNDNCHYWNFNNNLQCHLFDSSNRKCSVSRGLPEPTYEECN